MSGRAGARRVGVCLALALAAPTSAPCAPVASQAALPPAAADGPFGIRVGEPLSALGALKKLAPGMYLVLNPPKPNPKLPYVAVYAAPNGAVCLISGQTERYVGDLDGTTAVAAADELANLMTVKYGAANKKIDDCSDSDITCDQYFTTAVKKGLGEYRYEWVFGGAARPDRLKVIEVAVSADDEATSAVAITYRGDDQDACQAAQDAAKAEAAGGL
jgi:hypothetical protein